MPITRTPNALLFTETDSDVVTATSSSSELVPARSNRVRMYLVNTGNKTAYINFGAAATLLDLPIPAGTSVELDVASGMTDEAVFGITSAATTTLTIFEGFN